VGQVSESIVFEPETETLHDVLESHLGPVKAQLKLHIPLNIPNLDVWLRKPSQSQSTKGVFNRTRVKSEKDDLAKSVVSNLIPSTVHLSKSHEQSVEPVPDFALLDNLGLAKGKHVWLDVKPVRLAEMAPVAFVLLDDVVKRRHELEPRVPTITGHGPASLFVQNVSHVEVCDTSFGEGVIAVSRSVGVAANLCLAEVFKVEGNQHVISCRSLVESERVSGVDDWQDIV
jgi:hypothetical protein